MLLLEVCTVMLGKLDYSVYLTAYNRQHSDVLCLQSG